MGTSVPNQYHYGDFPVNVIKQVAARSGMDSKMAELIATMDLASYGVGFKRDGDSFGWLGTVNEGESDGESEQGFMAGKWV
ncbi:hypothetical protein Tco_0515056 [Tanacetum coccineum]